RIDGDARVHRDGVAISPRYGGVALATLRFRGPGDRVIMAADECEAEAVMWGFAILLTVAAINAAAPSAFAEVTIRLAQTSTATNCMMTCNAQAASCQTACVVPGTPPSAAATTTSNATASTMCLLNCITSQLSCQTNCARQSPSR